MTGRLRVRLAMVGAGSAELVGAPLHRSGIKAVIIEECRAEHVLSRIRAGLLEQGTAEFA